MGDATGIEWTDATWNPVVGCSVVSPGCTNCYAMKMAARIENIDAKQRIRDYVAHRYLDEMHPAGRDPARSAKLEARTHYAGTTQQSKAGAVWTGKVALAPDPILLAPLRWRRPRRIFVNSMGDLFHESVPDVWIDKVFAVMALAPQHMFQVLTKRSARMREYLSSGIARRPLLSAEIGRMVARAGRDMEAAMAAVDRALALPLRNVWLGVSAEDQPRANERIPDLLATPAAVRFVSAEPLLGPIDLECVPWPSGWDRGTDDPSDGIDPLLFNRAHLDWIIAGGESGPHARPMHPDWARNLRDQCAAAGVPFFFKQWGEWKPLIDRERDDPDWREDYRFTYEHRGKMHWLNLAGGIGFHGERFHVMGRVGRRAAGRLLDGREHNDMPRAAR